MPDWFGQLQRLPVDRVVVAHEPHTPRYDRAGAKRGYVTREGQYLGWRSAESNQEISVEIAVWAPNPSGRGPGFYTCFRLYHRDQVVGLALLFAFYDGSEKSPALKSLDSAMALARRHGFSLKNHDST